LGSWGAPAAPPVPPAPTKLSVQVSQSPTGNSNPKTKFLTVKMETLYRDDVTGVGISVAELRERAGDNPDAEAFKRAKVGISRINLNLATGFRKVVIKTGTKMEEKSFRLKELDEKLDVARINHRSTGIRRPADRTPFPKNNVPTPTLIINDNRVQGMDVPNIENPGVMSFKRFNPSFRTTTVPASFARMLENVTVNAMENERQDLLDAVSELVNVSREHALTNGTVQGMIRRLVAIDEVRVRINTDPWTGDSTMWSPKRKEAWPTKNEFPAVLQSLKKYFPFRVTDDGPKDHELLSWELQRRDAGLPGAVRYKGKSDSGLLLKKTNEAVSKEETISADIAFSEMLLNFMQTLPNPTAAMRWTSQHPAYIASAAKPKFEVTKLTTIDGKIAPKKVRVILVYSGCCTLAAQSFINAVSVGHIFPAEDNESRSLAGFNPFGGGADKLLKLIAYDCSPPRKSQGDLLAGRRVKRGYSVFGYSDNLYTGLPVRENGKVTHIRLHSLDGEKQEVSITFKKARLAMLHLMEHCPGLSKGWQNYLLGFVPTMATKSIALLGNSEIIVDMMGSGVPGTFTNNQTAVIGAIMYELEAHYKGDLRVFWMDAIKHETANDAVGFNGPDSEFKFSDRFNELMHRLGQRMTIESVCDIPLKHDRENLKVYKADLLGFDIVSLAPFGVERYVPVLDRSRLTKSYVFGHRPDRDVRNVDADPEIVSFSALHRYLVVSTLYLIGGWYYRDLAEIMLLEARQKLTSLVNADLTYERSTLVDILSDQAGLNGDVIEGMLPIVERKLIPNALTAMTTFGLTDEEFIKARIGLVNMGWISELQSPEGEPVAHEGGQPLTLEQALKLVPKEARPKYTGGTIIKPGTTVEKSFKEPEPTRPMPDDAEPGAPQNQKPPPMRRKIPEFIKGLEKFDPAMANLDEAGEAYFGYQGSLMLPAVPNKQGIATFNSSAAHWSRWVSERVDGLTVEEARKIIVDQKFEFYNKGKAVPEVDESGKVINLQMNYGEPVQGKLPSKPPQESRRKVAFEDSGPAARGPLPPGPRGGGAVGRYRSGNEGRRDAARDKGREQRIRAGRDAKQSR